MNNILFEKISTFYVKYIKMFNISLLSVYG